MFVQIVLEDFVVNSRLLESSCLTAGCRNNFAVFRQFSGRIFLDFDHIALSAHLDVVHFQRVSLLVD
jgi:hypothetical protein